jgi:hypothetical protein
VTLKPAPPDWLLEGGALALYHRHAVGAEDAADLGQRPPAVGEHAVERGVLEREPLLGVEPHVVHARQGAQASVDAGRRRDVQDADAGTRQQALGAEEQPQQALRRVGPAARADGAGGTVAEAAEAAVAAGQRTSFPAQRMRSRIRAASLPLCDSFVVPPPPSGARRVEQSEVLARGSTGAATVAGPGRGARETREFRPPLKYLAS